MSRKDKIHKLLNEAVDEIHAFIKESESEYKDCWMSAADIKKLRELAPTGCRNQFADK